MRVTLLLVRCFPQIPHGDSDDPSALVEAVRNRWLVIWSDSSGELVGGLVLVESSCGGVPGLGDLACWWSRAESVDDSVRWVAARLSASDVGVVVKPGGDVGEARLERRSLAGEFVSSCEFPIDARQLFLETLDFLLSVTDLARKVLDAVSGVSDSGFATSAAEGPIVHLEVCLGGSQPVTIVVELLTRVLQVTPGLVAISGKPVEVAVELGEC